MNVNQKPNSASLRSLDRKLASIAAGTYSPDDFIIADADAR